VPGAVILKGNDDIFILADCAESALIIRPKAAISRVFLRFIGNSHYTPDFKSRLPVSPQKSQYPDAVHATANKVAAFGKSVPLGIDHADSGGTPNKGLTFRGWPFCLESGDDLRGEEIVFTAIALHYKLFGYGHWEFCAEIL
jgi:hypothetical protein